MPTRNPAIILLGALMSALACAQDNHVPAGFGDGDGEKSLESLIEFPELRGDASVTISCIGILSAKGRLEEHSCYRRNPGDDVFGEAIYKAVKKARLTPALYNGRPVPVVFQYRILFVQKGDDQSMLFVANPGYEENVDAYGSGHIAAQRLMGKETWQSSCPQQTRFVVVARANVDFDGTPSAVSIEHADGIPITEKCRQALVESLLQSRFIPAMADGEAVPSTFIEPFGN